ncbi:MAG: hypothetical protein RI894_275, partial [Bacteroidota bacterium]
MLKKTFHLILFLGLCSQFADAQNLVNNPSFELTNSCHLDYYLGMRHPIDTAYYTFNTDYPTVQNWFCGNLLYGGYMNRCAVETLAQIPTNILGNRQPHTGDAYAGFETFLITCDAIQRNYLQTKLQEPLVKGKRYCVSYYLSPVAAFRHQLLKFVSTTDLYLILTPTRPFNPLFGGICLPTDNFMLTLPPNTDYIAPTQAFTDTTKWHKVQRIYIAKGGEQWLTIGCFKDDTHVTYSLIKDGDPRGIFCAYYIDDVTVAPLPAPLSTLKDTATCGFPLLLSANTGFSAYHWNTGDTSRSITVTQAGNYWVRGSLDECGDVTDTIHVRQKQPPVLALADTLVCSTQLPIVYHAPPLDATINWSTQDTGNSATIAQAGSYSVTATNECGSSTAYFTISTETPLPPIHFSMFDTTTCLNGHFVPIRLHAPIGYPNYHWNTGETTRSITVRKPQTYTVSSENLCGEVSSNINIGGCSPSYYIPNTFSPNGDGKNDFFTLYSNDAVRVIKQLQIFDRYGEYVFSAENIAPNDERSGWNGTLHGKEFTPDV